MKASLTIFLMAVSLSCQYCTKTDRSSNSSSTVPTADLTSVDPVSFEDDELDLPYYVEHFHRVANAIIMEGPNRGFIDIPVWRREKDNEPYNARVMENILSLAFFYANDRPWNPYYGTTQVRSRLEAALTFWCNMQSPEGAFSEYGPEKWNLAATAFATKFMGESLHWLNRGPAITDTLLQRVIATDRKAIHLVLTDSAFYDFGKRYSNQYSNVWAGGLAYLDLYHDEEIQTLLEERLRQSVSDFQSPTGYFYEAGGPDWSYNLGTHHSNLHMAFHYAKDDNVRAILAQKDRAFTEWLSYNSVPDELLQEFILNRGVECRQLRPSFQRYGWFLSQGMPLTFVDSLSHAFTMTQEEVKTEISRARDRLIEHWPEVDTLSPGEFSTFSPYAFLHRQHQKYYPARTERQAAMDQLPINREPFTHQRYDARNETVYTFVRTPSYYAAFNSGQKVRDQQRYGLGLIWSLSTGAIVQTQTRTTTAAWGTRIHSDSLPQEALDLEATFSLDNNPIALQSGNRDLPGQKLTISYDLFNQGKKRIAFLPGRLQVEVQYPGPFYEHLPLLIPLDKAAIIEPGKVTLPSEKGDTQITFSNTPAPRLIITEEKVGSKKVAVLIFTAQNNMSYEILF